jgi:hypothetical protein
MSIYGTGLKDTNLKFRMLLIFFGGMAAFGAIIYWRQATLRQADYTELPVHKTQLVNSALHSKNFDLEVQDSSPTVK